MTTMTGVADGGASVDEQIGLGVHMRMYRARITQKALATELGIQQSAVSRKLRGARPWLAAELVVVAQLLGVSPGELLPGFDGPTPPRDGGPTAVDGGSTTHRYVARKRHLIAVDDLLGASPSEDVEPAAARIRGVDDGPLSDAMALSPFAPGLSVVPLSTAVPA